MRFWSNRKKSVKSQSAALSMERLEERAMMAVIPIVSDQATTFYDADGTRVTVKLSGPGQGTLELTNGLLTDGAIDNLTLTGTTGASKLKISTRGGSVHGTTINELVIEKALNELGALKHIKAKKVDFADNGQLLADGSIKKIHFRNLGENATIDVAGDVKRLKTDTLETESSIEIAGVLKKFVAQLLATGSQVSSAQLDHLHVKQEAQGATVDIGEGGLAKAKIKNIYNSSISSQGTIGNVVVKGDIMGTALASNIDRGSDELFGTIDDFIIDRSAIGYIQSVKLKGAVGSEGAQKVRIVSSGQVGDVRVDAAATAQGATPLIWEQAASVFTPLSVIQASLDATGFSDDEIYIAIFGQELAPEATTGLSYYLAPSGTPGQLPSLTATSTLPSPSGSTPNLVTLPSFTLQDWKDATQTWGSALNFPTPAPNNEWTGRIVISAGAPVQAQVAANGTVSAPSPSDPTDPSTGTFYDFVEFTVTADANGNPSLDADTSQVDSFGMPLALQFFQPQTIAFSGTIDTSNNSITGIANTTGLAVGQTVSGSNIPNGAAISGVVPSTTTTPGSITLNATLATPGPGSFTATSSTWQAYDFDFSGVVASNHKTITGVTNLNTLVKQQYFGIGQPIFASGILAAGTVVVDYDIDASTITLNLPAIGSTPNGLTTNFTYNVAGPVGVEAERDEIVSLANANGLTHFLQQLVAGGNDFARPFLQSTAPFIANGPVLISGVSNNGAPITITTSGTSVLSAGDIIEIDGVEGTTAANGVFEVASTSGTTIVLGSPIANGTYTSDGTWSIAGLPVLNTTTSQAVIATPDTTAANLQNGDTVTISGVQGNLAVNGEFSVANVQNNSFELAGPIGSGTYSPSGTWTLAGSSTSVPITNMTGDGVAITLTTNSAGLVAGDVVTVAGVTGNTAANGTFVVTAPTGTGFTLGSPASTTAYTSGGTWSTGSTQYSITGATRGGQVVVTTNGTAGLVNGDTVTVSNVVGNTAANGTFTVSEVTPTSFALDGTQTNGVFISGGTWTEANAPTFNVTGASDGPIVISTSNTGGLQNGDLVTITGVGGNTAANGAFVVSNVIANTSFELANPIGNANYQKLGTWSMSVADASNAVITTASTTGLHDGDYVSIVGVLGNTAVDGDFVVGNVTPTSFALLAPVGIGDYTSGGTWSLASGGPNINITSVTDNGVPVVVTAESVAGLEVGTIISIQNVGGNIMADGWFVVAAIDGFDITLGAPVCATPFTASSGTWTGNNGGSGIVHYASKGDEITIVTANTAGLLTGSMVEVMGVQGNGGANNIFYVGEVTDTTFTLQGSTYAGEYAFGGTWKQFASLNRLVSPKDLAESLTDPADLSAINNYFNVLIDDFFLQYLPSSKITNGWPGIGETFEIVSTAYNGSPITYSGIFQEVTINNPQGVLQYSGYALSLKETGATPTDPNTYNIVYPFFSTNAPSPEVYTPLFGSFEAPTWIISNNQQYEAASQMIFACDNIFADNVAREGIDIPNSGNATKVLGDLEDSIAAAFNRGIVMNDPSTWNDVTTWYQANSEFNSYNYWSQYWHQSDLTFGDLAYAFPYDDKFGLSTNLEVSEVGLAQITLGNWGSTKDVAQISLTSPTSQPIAQNGAASFTATLSGTHGTPTGSVAFFMNGAPLNSINDSASPPLQLIPLLINGSATISVNLPATPDAGNPHTYTVTAVYIGDGTYLPTVQTMQVQIAAA